MAGLIQNAQIESADITFDRGFILTAWVHLKFGGGSVQGFGGYVLGGSPFDETAACARHENQKNIAADFIGGIMAVAGVDKFSNLPGKVIRIEHDQPFGSILAIGHPIKDRWYRPEKRFELLAPADAMIAEGEKP